MKRRRPRKKPAPVVVAVIDVGSTSVRMHVSEVHPKGRTVAVDTLVCPVDLGTDTFRHGYIGATTLRSLCQVMMNFSQVMKEYGVVHHRAVATSAVRDASNRDLVVDRIRHDSGFELEILDTVEETRITFQVLIHRMRKEKLLSGKHTLVVDLGGGSTETMVLRGENLMLAGTRRLGAQRLFQIASSPDAANSLKLLESATFNMVDRIVHLYRAYPISQCVFINSLIYRVMESRPGVQKRGAGLLVPGAAIEEAIRCVQDLSHGDLAETFDLDATDSELFLPAILALARFAEMTDVRQVLVTDMETATGVLWEMAQKLSRRNPAESFKAQTIRSAIGLGAKFRFDARHARHVARLATKIFDGVREYLDLSEKDRLYLEVAAILHDIGLFVSEGAHHKHSEYLIEWAEIIGLSKRERTLVSQLARYHRRNVPQPSHPVFGGLPGADRIRITKLTAVLRVADALDRTHTQQVEDVTPRMDEDDLVLECVSEGELVVEELALKEKGDLIQDITGLHLRLVRIFP